MTSAIRLLALIAGFSAPCFAQAGPDLHDYFRNSIQLSEKQINAVRNGTGFSKTLASRIPDEILVFGAIYINARPEDYVMFSRDISRLRRRPEYLAIESISFPPEISDMMGFQLDVDEVRSLKACKPGKCPLQMSAALIERITQSIDWSAPDTRERANEILQEAVYEQLSAYLREGNRALGTYNDKQSPADAADRFRHILGYSELWPRHLPDLYNYLLNYPQGRPDNVEDTFYWTKVKFGLKPTLRVVHTVTMRGGASGDPAFVIAEKQLYASHYFHAALDLTFCISDAPDPSRPGFFLIRVLGSEQAGLTGILGSIIRRVAISRSSASLKKALSAIKTELERNAVRP